MDGADGRPLLQGAQDVGELGRTQQYGAVFVRLVFLLDAAVLYMSLYVVVKQLGLDWGQRFVTLALVSIMLSGVLTSMDQLYRPWRLNRLGAEVLRTQFLLSLTFAALAVTLLAGTHWFDDPAYVLLVVAWYALASLSLPGVRLATRLFLWAYRAGTADHRRVAIYGASATAHRLASVFASHPWMGIDVLGFYDDARSDGVGNGGPGGAGVSGGLQDLLALARANEVGAVYIALPLAAEARAKAVVDAFADTTVSIYYCPPVLDLNVLNAQWDDVFGQPVIGVVASPFDSYKRHFKRLEDLCITALALPVLLLPMAAIAIAVKLSSPGPVLYRQTRSGLCGRPFRIYKFRTMHTLDGDDEFTQARRNDPRITPLGAVLRRTSLDELPQFFNVILGDMSVVGPRPAPVKYNEDHRHIYRYMVRHKVKPGITGLAQVNGARGETETIAKTEQRTTLDLRYINTWSLLLDLKIIWRTVFLVAADFRPR